jgi:RNA polymerase sigma-70 factor, ECF subfamily
VKLAPADEQRLLLGARLQDAEALAVIFDTYYDAIFRYIYVRVGHEQASEDLAAQVFQRLLAHLRKHNCDFSIQGGHGVFLILCMI